MPTPLESKIAATDRLRQEGRWDEASRFRDDQRLKLKEAGIKGSAAKEEAWRIMLDWYPPIQQDCTEHFLHLAAYPPIDRNSAHPDFPAAWLAYCTMQAVSSLLLEDPTATAVAAKILEIAIEAAASGEEEAVVRRAFDETEEVFESIVAPAFVAQLARLKGTDQVTQSQRAEIERHLCDVMDPVARFIVLAEEGWEWV